MSKLTLGYWYMRGLGEPARMILEYSGVEYEDKRYNSYEEWLGGPKFKMGLDFPNLPYLLDGDVKLTESWAIYRYLGRKFGLFPTEEKDIMESDMLQGFIADLLKSFGRVTYELQLEEFELHVREKQPPKLRLLNAFLSGRNFLLGDKISFVDFPLYETLDQHRLFMPEILDEFPNLQAFMKKFGSQERISAYFESNRYNKHKHALYGPKACWGFVSPKDIK